MSLAKDSKNSKNDFFSYIQGEKKIKERGDPLLSEYGEMLMGGKEKGELLKPYFAFVSSTRRNLAKLV